MSVLITAANSAQAYQLKSILAKEQTVLLGDHLDIPTLLVNSGKIIKTPRPEGVSFAHEMLTLCLDKGITSVYPLRKAELLPLAQARQLFLEFDIDLIIPQIDLISTHLTVIEGSLVVLERSEIIAGDREIAIPEGLTDGTFKINNQGAYQIFTAD